MHLDSLDSTMLLYLDLLWPCLQKPQTPLAAPACLSRRHCLLETPDSPFLGPKFLGILDRIRTSNHQELPGTRAGTWIKTKEVDWVH